MPKLKNRKGYYYAPYIPDILSKLVNFKVAPKDTEIQANWDNARLYCMFLEIDSKTGWRLPTKDELNEIYLSDNDFENVWYWSSTELNGYGAWVQGFSDGSQANGTKNYGGYYVRAVRTIKE